MRRVALTGGIACGKSVVGAILQRHGVAVCDADHVAHAVMRAGHAAYDEIVRTFGRGVVGVDGELDRSQLGRLVFADEAARQQLNAIVHPRVRVAWEAWLRAQETAGPLVAVVIIPLLFEAGMDAGWDAIVCVRSPPVQQRQRLAARGLSEREIDQRLMAQWPVSEKAARADYVIDNDDSVAELEERTVNVVNQIVESKHGRSR